MSAAVAVLLALNPIAFLSPGCGQSDPGQHFPLAFADWEAAQRAGSGEREREGDVRDADRTDARTG